MSLMCSTIRSCDYMYRVLGGNNAVGEDLDIDFGKGYSVEVLVKELVKVVEEYGEFQDEVAV